MNSPILSSRAKSPGLSSRAKKFARSANDPHSRGTCFYERVANINTLDRRPCHGFNNQQQTQPWYPIACADVRDNACAC
jgi:hypothetical protein